MVPVINCAGFAEVCADAQGYLWHGALHKQIHSLRQGAGQRSLRMTVLEGVGIALPLLLALQSLVFQFSHLQSPGFCLSLRPQNRGMEQW